MDNGTSEPQIKVIYIDPQGFPHKIIERDSDGFWRNQHGDNITPGVFRTYKRWTEDIGQKLLNAVQEAVTQLEAGNDKPIEKMLNHPATKAQMNMAKPKIKNFLGDAKFQKLLDYSKSRREPEPLPEPLPNGYRPTLKELTSAPSLPPLTHLAFVDRGDDEINKCH